MKTAIELRLLLSRIDKKIFVAIDGNLLDVNDFGISASEFSEMGFRIDKILQQILGNKDDLLA